VGYPIWSNSLGCFDDEPAGAGEYVYFAGDSFLWGYAPFEDKFATRIEAETGIPVLACGVEHTGQRHQLIKLQRTVEHVGREPNAVFVFFFENDVANDYAHPHSTVMDGWLMDAVTLDDANQLVHHSPDELAARLREGLDRFRRAQALEEREPGRRSAALKGLVKRYSLSANIVNALVNRATEATELSAEQVTTSAGLRAPPARTDAALPGLSSSTTPRFATRARPGAGRCRTMCRTNSRPTSSAAAWRKVFFASGANRATPRSSSRSAVRSERSVRAAARGEWWKPQRCSSMRSCRKSRCANGFCPCLSPCAFCLRPTRTR
jgi:hypothetical protein